MGNCRCLYSIKYSANATSNTTAIYWVFEQTYIEAIHEPYKICKFHIFIFSLVSAQDMSDPCCAYLPSQNSPPGNHPKSQPCNLPGNQLDFQPGNLLENRPGSQQSTPQHSRQIYQLFRSQIATLGSESNSRLINMVSMRRSWKTSDGPILPITTSYHLFRFLKGTKLHGHFILWM